MVKYTYWEVIHLLPCSKRTVPQIFVVMLEYRFIEVGLYWFCGMQYKNTILVFLALILVSACSGTADDNATPTSPSIVGELPAIGITIEPIVIATETPTLVPSPQVTSLFPSATPTAMTQSGVVPTAFSIPSDNTNTTAGTPAPEVAAVASAAPGQSTGRVAAGRTGLRLRSLPSENAAIITNLTELTGLSITGRTSDNVWLAVTTDGGFSGWVLTAYVEVNVDINSVPVNDVDPAVIANLPTQPAQEVAVANISVPTGSNGYVSAEGNGVRLRSQPSTNAQIMGVIPERTQVTVLGRNQDGSWLQIQSAQGTGWVFASYIQSSLDVAALNVPAAAYEATPVRFEPPSPSVSYGALSGVSSNSAKIFMTGQQLGNRPNVFSKVGDSITATGQFLYTFGWGTYNLRDYAYYQEVINFFLSGSAREGNPFATGSLSAQPYWTSSTVLDPSKASPPCNAGEMPLVCEYRVNRPSMALIMIGTNDIGQNSAGQFQANLQRIVEISIQMGVIPVLSTLPPKVCCPGDVDQFNSIIVSTARGYDVPLWDYYSAMIQLPNQGLNEDGVHPAWIGGQYDNYAPSGDFSADNLKYGFPLRNLMALQVLDTMWRQVIAPNQGQTTVTGNNTDRLNSSLLTIPQAQGQTIVNPALPTPVVPAAGGNGTNITANTSSTGTCPGAPASRLTVGGLGRVTPGTANNFRSGPSSGSAKIGELPGSAVFTVLEGPVCADGMAYWRVNYNGQEGWTAEGRGGSYWLEPL